MAEKYLANIGERIGLLGGTFDPIHNGHIAAARAVYNELSLDAVVFVPSFFPPHKNYPEVSSFASRNAMLNMALGAQIGFFVSTLESQRKGPSYTTDTLQQIRAAWGGGKQLFFIVGLDAFTEITTWKNYQDLFSYSDFAVIGRPPFQKRLLHDYIVNNLPGFDASQEGEVWQSRFCSGKIYLVTMSPVDISSTGIRQRLAAGNSIKDLVPECVSKYIASKGLYGR